MLFRSAQEQHKLERLENRKKYLEKGERTKRTHRLCNLGGKMCIRDSLCIKDMSRMGRDYLKVGQIMEILRQRGVRLIAINDLSLIHIFLGYQGQTHTTLFLKLTKTTTNYSCSIKRPN